MLSLSSAYRYYLYQGQAHMSNGFDGLSGLVRNALHRDPLNGDIFIFFNARGNQIKLLLWEGDGFAIYHKRLEKGTYELPKVNPLTQSMEIRSDELMLILKGISLQSVCRRKRFSFDEKKSQQVTL